MYVWSKQDYITLKKLEQKKQEYKTKQKEYKSNSAGEGTPSAPEK